ncbi:MAG: hypothetical protein HC905_15250 [Bacteroidales bacterium]|nr:hypothetical protein [Bacteroidales bacterium]
MSYAELLKILGLKKDEVYGNKQLTKGLKGNTTQTKIAKCFTNREHYKDLIIFNPSIETHKSECYLVDKKNGRDIGYKT